MQSATRYHRQIYMAGTLLGVALGGFFDGILLHQILQWHHLLSGLEAAGADLSRMILYDGLFHALMYVLMLAGLVMLWRQRPHLDTAAGSGSYPPSCSVSGYGMFWTPSCRTGF